MAEIETKARINKIIDSSVVDGPGNRTAIFFQGCNFNCKYCHNPETINHCNDCAACVDGCPSSALSVQQGKTLWDQAKCVDCDSCVKTCRFNSSPKILQLTVDEVVACVKRNMPFIKGITVSGGECTLQAKFLQELFQETHKLGLTNFIDSNGSLRFSALEGLMEHTDAVMLDVKAFDLQEHRELTGCGNEIVLENAHYLAGIGKLYEIRTVAVKDMLDNRRTVEEVTKMLSGYQKIKEIRYKIIQYRHFGVRQEYLGMKAPDEDELEELRLLAGVNGFVV